MSTCYSILVALNVPILVTEHMSKRLSVLGSTQNNILAYLESNNVLSDTMQKQM